MPNPLAAALLCIAATAALPAGAQITPAELWQDWQQAAAAAGARLDAAAAPGADGSLTLTGLRFGPALPTAAGKAEPNGEVAIGSARLEADGAGGVRVVIPAGQSIGIDLPAEGQAPVHLALPVSGADMVLRASGAPGAVAYALDPTDVAIDGAPATADAAAAGDRIRLSLPDLSGQIAADGTASFAAPRLDFDLAVTDPATGRFTHLAGHHDRPSLAVTREPDGTGAIARRIALGSAAADQHWQGREADGRSTGASLARGPGTLALTLSPDRFSLRGHGEAVRLTTLPTTPDARAHDILAAMADLSLSGPAAWTGPDLTLSLGAVLDGLTLPPEDWALLDPQGQMPRDPGSLVLDIDLVPEITAPPKLPDMTVEAQLRSVTIHRLSLDLAGVTLETTGAVRFVPAATTETPQGAPVPVGQIDAAATGLYGLVRGLTGAGLLSQEQALGLSIAMLMFAQPGEGDSLTSRVVAGPDGSLTVNGKAMSFGTP